MLSAGLLDSGAYTWTSQETIDCATSLRIYCFGDDENRYPVAPVPPPGARRAFITKMGVPVTTGRAAMDAACMADATAAGFTGTYLAWLPIAHAAASDRFTHTVPWIRRDGVVAIAADFSHMFAPLDVDAFGTYQYGVAWGWIDGPSGAPANTTYDCGDWSSTFGGAFVGEVSRGSFGAAFYDGSASLTNCTNAFYVYCLEQ